MNKQATYWKYTGNHPEGKDHIRYNPHNFTLKEISTLAYMGEGGNYEFPLTYEDTKTIKVSKREHNGFGCLVKVIAPSDVWKKIREIVNNNE